MSENYRVAPLLRAVACLLCLSLGLAVAPAIAIVAEPPPPDDITIPGDAEIEIIGGTSNGKLLWLDFDDSRALALNDPKADAGQRGGFSSLVFFENSCAVQQDIIAADTGRGELLLYSQAEIAQGVGIGMPLCDAIGCPERPNGLSVSDAGLVAAAESGLDGYAPAVWLFEPEPCGDQPAASSLLRSVYGGAFEVAGQGITKEIAATEFVRVTAGGLFAGDLLVLVRTLDGWTIARVAGSDIAGLLAIPGEVGSLDHLPAAEALLPTGAFGHARPTGMAFVPGSGEADRSGILLVTLKEGQVLQLVFEGGNDRPFLADSNELSFPPGTALRRLQGIATGLRDNAAFAVISDETTSADPHRFLLADLATTDTGAASISAVRSIETASGAPRGVAVLPEDDQQRCVDFTQGDRTTTGCILSDAVQVHLSMGYDGTLPDGARVSAELAFIPDPRPPGSKLPLKLELEGDEALIPGGGEYWVPASCRGFPVDPEDDRFGGVPQLVLLNMGLNFDITAGNFIQVRELAIQSLGLDEELPQNKCDQTGARIYYHPQDDSGGTLFDTTFSCQNPSRSIVETFSPVVFCVDPLYLARKFASPGEKKSQEVSKQIAVNHEVGNRVAELKSILRDLPNTPELVALAKRLEKQLNIANVNASGIRPRYLRALRNVNNAALDVFTAKTEQGLFDPLNQPGVDNITYGRLLSRILALAFYISETGALEEYRPPAAFCELTYDVDGDGIADFPEIPDVECEGNPG